MYIVLIEIYLNFFLLLDKHVRTTQVISSPLVLLVTLIILKLCNLNYVAIAHLAAAKSITQLHLDGVLETDGETWVLSLLSLSSISFALVQSCTGSVKVEDKLNNSMILDIYTLFSTINFVFYNNKTNYKSFFFVIKPRIFLYVDMYYAMIFFKKNVYTILSDLYGN